jgi:hypothetical protein
MPPKTTLYIDIDDTIIAQVLPRQALTCGRA